VVTTDGETVMMDMDIVEMSGLIKTMIEDGNAEDAIPLANITKPILDKVIEFCVHI